MIQTDYLIIGSGVAGLTFAIKIASQFPEKKVTLVTKSSEAESNTKYAQGGIAVVLNQIEDNFLRNKQVHFINVETAAGCSMQSGKSCGKFLWNFTFFTIQDSC